MSGPPKPPPLPSPPPPGRISRMPPIVPNPPPKPGLMLPEPGTISPPPYHSHTQPRRNNQPRPASETDREIGARELPANSAFDRSRHLPSEGCDPECPTSHRKKRSCRRPGEYRAEGPRTGGGSGGAFPPLQPCACARALHPVGHVCTPRASPRPRLPADLLLQRRDSDSLPALLLASSGSPSQGSNARHLGRAPARGKSIQCHNSLGYMATTAHTRIWHRTALLQSLQVCATLPSACSGR